MLACPPTRRDADRPTRLSNRPSCANARPRLRSKPQVAGKPLPRLSKNCPPPKDRTPIQRRHRFLSAARAPCCIDLYRTSLRPRCCRSIPIATPSEPSAATRSPVLRFLFLVPFFTSLSQYFHLFAQQLLAAMNPPLHC